MRNVKIYSRSEIEWEMRRPDTVLVFYNCKIPKLPTPKSPNICILRAFLEFSVSLWGEVLHSLDSHYFDHYCVSCPGEKLFYDQIFFVWNYRYLKVTLDLYWPDSESGWVDWLIGKKALSTPILFYFLVISDNTQI